MPDGADRKSRSGRRVGKARLNDAAALSHLYANSLSRRLLFLCTEHPLPMGAPFDLQIWVGSRFFKLTAAVRFVADAKGPRGAGCGVELLDPKDIIEARVADLGGDVALPPQAVGGAFTPAAIQVTFDGDAPVSAAAPAVVDPAPAAPRARRSEMRKALVVEDDPDVQRVYMRMLQPAGFEVMAAKDGVDALELLGKHHFSLLVVDYLLPRLDGVKLLEEVFAKRTIPTIFASAVMRDHRVVGKLRALGVQWILEKPFRLEALRKVFDEAIHAAQHYELD